MDPGSFAHLRWCPGISTRKASGGRTLQRPWQLPPHLGSATHALASPECGQAVCFRKVRCLPAVSVLHAPWRAVVCASQSWIGWLHWCLTLPKPVFQQDVYGLYDPRYRPYDSTASAYAENYRYPEPERPSSRASHCSDRPAAR